MESLSKRLLALGQLSCWLEGTDGHIWIMSEDDISTLNFILKKSGIALNNKIYGGVLEALDTIDECLRLSNEKTLEEKFDEWIESALFLGDPGIGESRIDRVKSGEGGIF